MRRVLLVGFVVSWLAAGACTSFGTGEPPAGDASVQDALAPDAVPPADAAPSPEAGQDGALPRACSWAPRGTDTPCTTCIHEEVAIAPIVPNPEGGVLAQYAFGLTADETHVYWIEQGTRDGFSDVGVVKRRAVTSSVPTPIETLAVLTGSPRTLVLTQRDLFVGFHRNQSRAVARFSKACTPPCTPSYEGTALSVRGMARYETGALVTSLSEIRTLPETRNIPFNAQGPGAGVAWFNGQIVSVREVAEGGAGSANGYLYPSNATFPLLASHPFEADAAPKGGALVAAGCQGIWSFQYFNPTGQAVSYFVPGAEAAVGTAAKLTFGMAADATHAYLAHPDGIGLSRVGTDGKLEVLLQGDIWNVAVTDEWVYFDDHASMRAKISRFRKSQ